jgi:hypothetical protein
MTPIELIHELSGNSAKLREAMQGSNLAAIEEATKEFQAALEKVQAVGKWTADPELREKLVELRPELDESRKIACLLADMTGQMHELISKRILDARQPVYKRSGAIG